MVAFLHTHSSSNSGNDVVLLLALNPFLVAASVAREETQTWSETRCLEDMRARGSAMGRWLRKGADLLTGQLLDDDDVLDMEPVAAVAADHNDESVFTLHSDGEVRHWIYKGAGGGAGGDPDSLLRPHAVRSLPVQPHLPNPTVWTDGWNTTFMTADRLQHHAERFVLAIHIQTSQEAAARPSTKARCDRHRRRTPC